MRRSGRRPAASFRRGRRRCSPTRRPRTRPRRSTCRSRPWSAGPRRPSETPGCAGCRSTWAGACSHSPHGSSQHQMRAFRTGCRVLPRNARDLIIWDWMTRAPQARRPSPQDGLWVGALRQDVQQIGRRHEVKAWERHPLCLQIILSSKRGTAKSWRFTPSHALCTRQDLFSSRTASVCQHSTCSSSDASVSQPVAHLEGLLAHLQLL